MPHVTFIHGIGNKPASDVLQQAWIDALRDGDGVDLPSAGVTTSLCYWADVLYESPTILSAGADEATDSEGSDVLGPDPRWFTDLSGAERAEVRQLAVRVGALGALDPLDTPAEPPDPRFERIPLPGPVKRRFMQAFLRDVHHYLWNTDYTPRPGTHFATRDEVRHRAVVTLGRADSRPHVVVAHSLGSVIAYDVLRNVEASPDVDGLLTLGSPLGLDEVQDRLGPGWSRRDGFPSATVPSDRWVNVFDRRDPVCGLDPKIADDFQRTGVSLIRDIHEPNWGRWRHAVDKYLSGPKLRASLTELLELA